MLNESIYIYLHSLLISGNVFFMSQLDNDIALQPPTPPVLEQVVELSILLTGQMYSNDLDDPASLQYQTLSRQLAEKVSLFFLSCSGLFSLFMTPLVLLYLTSAWTCFISQFMVCEDALLVLITRSNNSSNSETQSVRQEFRKHTDFMVHVWFW